ncbi:MAG: phage major capsid protein, partial [Armatimonadetes bacterium]|nr:phage major capsid protein [Armatimonadota bacterium]
QNLQRQFELVRHDASVSASEGPPSPELIEQPAQDEATRALQKANDELYLLCKLLGRPATRLKYFDDLRRRGIFGKALATTAAGAGAEWVPQGFSALLHAAVNQELRLGGIHDRIDMPTKTYRMPVEGADPQAYLTSENAEITPSDAGTAEVVLDAVTIAARQLLSAELSEDSVVPILPRLQAQIARSIARGIENAIVNGDTDTTHMDADVTQASDVRKAWDGYRKKALTDDDANVDLSTLDAEALLSIKRAMGKYAIDPDECVWVVGNSVFNQLLLLRDSAGNPLVTTVDKYGAQATVLTGELGRLFGIPVIVSPVVREDLNASGVYDGSTTDRTVLFLVNRRAWVLGDRRRITLETDKDIGRQQVQLVATWRGDFAHCFGSDLTVGMGYNIAA